MGNFVEVDRESTSGSNVSKWVRLRHTSQVVAVVCDHWEGLEGRIESSVDGRNVVRRCYNDGDLICRANRAEVFDTPGYVRLVTNQPSEHIQMLVYADPDNELVADHSLEEVLLLSSGFSEWLPLTSTKDHVCVSSADWAGTSVTLELSFDGRFIFPLGEHGAELICRENVSRAIEIGGMVRLNASSLVSPVRLSVASFNVIAQTNAERQNTNTLMIDYLQTHPEATHFTARQWATAIERAPSSIHSTKTWKSLMSVREQAKQDRKIVQSDWQPNEQ